MKFRIAKDNRKTPIQSDSTGIIVVKVWRAEKGHGYAKGNIVRTIRLEDCKVSQVFDAIVAAIT